MSNVDEKELHATSFALRKSGSKSWVVITVQSSSPEQTQRTVDSIKRGDEALRLLREIDRALAGALPLNLTVCAMLRDRIRSVLPPRTDPALERLQAAADAASGLDPTPGSE